MSNPATFERQETPFGILSAPPGMMACYQAYLIGKDPEGSAKGDLRLTGAWGHVNTNDPAVMDWMLRNLPLAVKGEKTEDAPNAGMFVAIGPFRGNVSCARALFLILTKITLMEQHKAASKKLNVRQATG
jgi:hypothetical protein